MMTFLLSYPVPAQKMRWLMPIFFGGGGGTQFPPLPTNKGAMQNGSSAEIHNLLDTESYAKSPLINKI